MSERSFVLVPFPAPGLPAVSLSGGFSLAKNTLKVRYLLSGEIKSILLPPITHLPGRKDDLWKATCFEFFLALATQPGYWEFNMAPSGDWNVYRMDSYRRVGFREEPAIAKLSFGFRNVKEGLLVESSVDLTPILRPGEELQMGIAAILQTRDGNESYWALSHTAPHADFHLRESFIPVRAAQSHPLGQSVPAG